MRRLSVLALMIGLWNASTSPALGDYSPFLGVTYSHHETIYGGSRPLAYDVVDIDPTAPGIGFVVSGSNGTDPLDTNRETTREFVTREHAQIGINASFFNPSGDTYQTGDPATVGGLTASAGDTYVPFSASWSSINIGVDNSVTFLDSDPGTSAYNAVSGNHRLVTNGVAGSSTDPADLIPNARTVFAVNSIGHILLITVDGRDLSHSVGLTIPELSVFLVTNLDVVNAINLDGGGSTTMVLADGGPARVVNTPVGVGGVPGTERPVAVSLGVFARTVPEPSSVAMVAMGLFATLLVRGRRKNSSGC